MGGMNKPILLLLLATSSTFASVISFDGGNPQIHDRIKAKILQLPLSSFQGSDIVSQHVDPEKSLIQYKRKDSQNLIFQRPSTNDEAGVDVILIGGSADSKKIQRPTKWVRQRNTVPQKLMVLRRIPSEDDSSVPLYYLTTILVKPVQRTNGLGDEGDKKYHIVLRKKRTVDDIDSDEITTTTTKKPKHGHENDDVHTIHLIHGEGEEGKVLHLPVINTEEAQAAAIKNREKADATIAANDNDGDSSAVALAKGETGTVKANAVSQTGDDAIAMATNGTEANALALTEGGDGDALSSALTYGAGGAKSAAMNKGKGTSTSSAISKGEGAAQSDAMAMANNATASSLAGKGGAKSNALAKEDGSALANAAASEGGESKANAAALGTGNARAGSAATGGGNSTALSKANDGNSTAESHASDQGSSYAASWTKGDGHSLANSVTSGGGSSRAESKADGSGNAFANAYQQGASGDPIDVDDVANSFGVKTGDDLFDDPFFHRGVSHGGSGDGAQKKTKTIEGKPEKEYSDESSSEEKVKKKKKKKNRDRKRRATEWSAEEDSQKSPTFLPTFTLFDEDKKIISEGQQTNSKNDELVKTESLPEVEVSQLPVEQQKEAVIEATLPYLFNNYRRQEIIKNFMSAYQLSTVLNAAVQITNALEAEAEAEDEDEE